MVEAVDISEYTKIVERIAKRLHKGTLKAEDLDTQLIKKIYKDITEGTAKGWGQKDFVKFGDDLQKDKTILAMQKNIFEFSGAKTNAQLQEFNKLLHKDGKLRSFADFKKDVLKVNKRYNKNYLQAEYQTARQAGHHARNWQSFQKDKDLFPNLQYKTVNDSNVRPEHQALHGVIKPINDPFWDNYYPPNGWRCRCYVVQTTASPTKHSPEDPSIKSEFKVNVGKTGKIYTEGHPFFATFGKKARKRLQQLKKDIVDNTPENLAHYEKELGIKADRTFFKLLKDKVIFTQKNLDPRFSKKKGAYYHPVEKYVKIPINQRMMHSKWFSEAIIYHEFGHAIDWQTDMRFSKEIKTLRDKYKKRYAKDNDKLYKQINSSLRKIQYKAQKEGDYDASEKCLAVQDTLMSLNTGYGDGHSENYFNRKGTKEAEFIAHLFENGFKGNDIFKKEMPELYKDMLDFVKELQEKTKLK